MKNKKSTELMNRLGGEFAVHSHDFYLAEYDSLRREIVAMVSEARALERNVVIGVAAAWGWLFHEREHLPKLVWLLPCFFVVLGATRAWGFRRYFHDMFEYQCIVEKMFSSDQNSPGGWENFHRMRGWTRLSTIAFWALLFCSTSLVFLYEFIH